ncbi:MAG: nickel-responsive transcriptional regulator NikR [Planctomycetota bacterium]|jgi:CopG family nickel-responsive transcriptional regulator
MEKVERVGVSLDRELLADFDGRIAEEGYQNRSEAIRDLIRRHLNVLKVEDPKADAIATINVVYDHHDAQLMQKLTGLQHSHLLRTISSLHVHLNEHDCLEIIVLRGSVGQIREVGEAILSMKGVKLGYINLLTAESTGSVCPH